MDRWHQAQKHLGNAWQRISELLPGRTANMLKNRWHSAAFRRRIAQAAPQNPHGLQTSLDLIGGWHVQMEGGMRLLVRGAPLSAMEPRRGCAAVFVVSFRERSRRGVLRLIAPHRSSRPIMTMSCSTSLLRPTRPVHS